MRIACLGTSANPPHLGHLAAARQILKSAPIGPASAGSKTPLSGVDEVWFIPCYKHAFAKHLIPWQHRLKMIKMMEGPRIKICDIEKENGFSYTIKTLENLRKKYPEHQFSWAVGSDMILSNEYKKWKNWKELSRLVKFYVVQRPGYPLQKEKLPKCFEILPAIPFLMKDISSTLIRERLKRGLSISNLVISKVERYIIKNKLYI